MATKKKRMSEWNFSPPTLSSLPTDAPSNGTARRNVYGAVFSACRPTPLKEERRLIAVSEDALTEILDMDPAIAGDPQFADFVSGNLVLDGSAPVAHRYGGYQFGYWAGQLGDGRAHLLGEYVNSKGERWELQLKGSGETPFSRFADGRAVLRSSLREFLCSEAMHYLGVPTSRAAAIVVTDDPIPRDRFYNGRMKNEKAAVVLRLAPSWFRFGSFEILARNEEFRELRALADYVLQHSFPKVVEANPDSKEDQILSMFQAVASDTAAMIAHWLSVGFAHGVMNTDNMSVASVTIDFGPFGFVDEYDPNFIPNTSDDTGRYDLESQASIGLWNLQKLAVALAPLVADDEKRKQFDVVLDNYKAVYQAHFARLFRAKLGLKTAEDEDMKLVASLLSAMETKYADYTQTFRDLSEMSLDDAASGKIPEEAWGLSKIKDDEDFKTFISEYRDRISREGTSEAERKDLTQRANPRYVLRNWLAQRAIEMADEGDFSEVKKLLRVLKNPYKVQEEAEAADYAKPPPSWSRMLKVSCSS